MNRDNNLGVAVLATSTASGSFVGCLQLMATLWAIESNHGAIQESKVSETVDRQSFVTKAAVCRSVCSWSDCQQLPMGRTSRPSGTAWLFGAHAHHFALSVPPTAREPLWTALPGVTAFQNAVILKPDIRLEQPLECGGPRGYTAPLWIAAQPLWFLNVEPSQESGSTALQSGDDPPHSKSHRTRRSLGPSPSGPFRRVPLVSQLDLAAPSS